MTSRRRAIRSCPLCGIAMQASKSRESAADFDTFQCFSCQTTIIEQVIPARRGPSRLKRGTSAAQNGQLEIISVRPLTALAMAVSASWRKTAPHVNRPLKICNPAAGSVSFIGRRFFRHHDERSEAGYNCLAQYVARAITLSVFAKSMPSRPRH